MTEQSRETYPAGTVSHGTLRSEDLRGPLYRALRSLNKESALEHVEEYGPEPEGEDLDESIEDLFNRLNEVAPPGTYFGSHPGDGTDFGFWSVKMLEGEQ